MSSRLSRSGLPFSSTSKPLFMSVISVIASIIAQPMRWVKETLPARLRLRWLLMTRRLSNSSFTGTSRTEVAVGTPRDSFMFRTTAAAGPRSLTRSGSRSSTDGDLRGRGGDLRRAVRRGGDGRAPSWPASLTSRDRRSQQVLPSRAEKMPRGTRPRWRRIRRGPSRASPAEGQPARRERPAPVRARGPSQASSSTPRRRSRCPRTSSEDAGVHHAVGEILRPAGVDARGILLPLLAERVHEPLIRTEFRGVGALCLL